MRPRLWWIAAFIALLGCGACVGMAAAQESRAAATPATSATAPVLTLDPFPKAVVGYRPVVVGHLTRPDGTAMAREAVTLFVDDAREDNATTAENGTVVLRIKSELPAGTYAIRLTYDGDPKANVNPVSASGQLEIQPGTLSVKVVPALPDLHITLTPLPKSGPPAADAPNVTLITDESGIVTFPISEIGHYRAEVLPWASPDPGVKAEFSRWRENVFTPYRDVEYEPGIVLQAGFEVHYLVGYQFTNLQGDSIDPSEISSVTFTNSMGERIERTEHGAFWVKGGRVTRRSSGLEETRLQYSVDEVIVDGANVVNRAQNRFVPARTRSWTVPLLFYAMSFSSQDAIFGFPLGDMVEVVSPNGSVHTAALNADGLASLPLLPRGEYKVRVQGSGFSPTLPVALSKDQTVALKVISLLDAAFVGGLGASVALGLLIVGRWRSARTFRWFRRRAHADARSL
jgi:hypothetical protein